MTQRRWRSPPRVPRPRDPSLWRTPADPLQRLLLHAAWRTLGFAHCLAHGLKRAPVSTAQDDVLARAGRFARAAPAFLEAARRHGVEDGELLVEAKLSGEPLPWPESWAELGVADWLFGAALDVSLADLGRSADPAVARAAAPADPEGVAFGARVVEDLATTENLPCLQLLVDRWLPAAIRTFGPPNGPGETVLVAARVKPSPAADAVAAWLEAVDATLARLGLERQDGDQLGLDLPGHVRRFGRARSRDD